MGCLHKLHLRRSPFSLLAMECKAAPGHHRVIDLCEDKTEGLIQVIMDQLEPLVKETINCKAKLREAIGDAAKVSACDETVFLDYPSLLRKTAQCPYSLATSRYSIVTNFMNVKHICYIL